MKRSGIILIVFLAMFVAVMAARAADQSLIVNTKHNLSTSGTGSYHSVSGGAATSEICVFCHTPHRGVTDAPLWNRAAPASIYTPYTSDVLLQLQLTAESNLLGKKAHLKTLVCLSCHDGTIALGQVVNMPNDAIGGKISVVFTADTSKNTIQPTSPGYIGIDLSDDHPVAIPHDNSATHDTELMGVVNTLAPHVSLYDGATAQKTVNAGATNYVECTSCHDPHNNVFGNFLVDSNQGSKICTTCHNKTDFGSSSHANAATTYVPPDGVGGNLGTTVGGVGCMICHFPHKAGGTGTPPYMTPQTAGQQYGKYLLSFQKDPTCFNSPDRWNNLSTACHATGGAKDIYSVQVGKTSSHEYKSSYGYLHNALEGWDFSGTRTTANPGWMGNSGANLHVECSDCHNPHTAGKTSHVFQSPITSSFTLTSANPLYGAAGARISGAAWPTFVSTGTYVYRQGTGVKNSTSGSEVSFEYEICFKCHSDFAWASNTPPTTFTNQAAEFNPSIAAYHPVYQPDTNNSLGQMVAPWNSANATQMMMCSDCHNTDSVAGAKGPHGSGKPHMLAAAYDDTSGVGSTASSQPATDLCFNCHDYSTYVTGAGANTGFKTTLSVNLHTQHYADRQNAGSNFGYKCVNCHVMVPHGWDRRAMVIVRGEGATHGPNGSLYELAGGASITGWGVSGFPAQNQYADGIANKNMNCMTAKGCHQP